MSSILYLMVFVLGWSEPNFRLKMSNAFSKYSNASAYLPCS